MARARGRVARGNLWQQWALARGSHTGRPSGRAVRGEKVCRLPARENDTAALLVIGQLTSAPRYTFFQHGTACRACGSVGFWCRIRRTDAACDKAAVHAAGRHSGHFWHAWF